MEEATPEQHRAMAARRRTSNTSVTSNGSNSSNSTTNSNGSSSSSTRNSNSNSGPSSGNANSGGSKLPYLPFLQDMTPQQVAQLRTVGIQTPANGPQMDSDDDDIQILEPQPKGAKTAIPKTTPTRNEKEEEEEEISDEVNVETPSDQETQTTEIQTTEIQTLEIQITQPRKQKYSKYIPQPWKPKQLSTVHYLRTDNTLKRLGRHLIPEAKEFNEIAMVPYSGNHDAEGIPGGQLFWGTFLGDEGDTRRGYANLIVGKHLIEHHVTVATFPMQPIQLIAAFDELLVALRLTKLGFLLVRTWSYHGGMYGAWYCVSWLSPLFWKRHQEYHTWNDKLRLNPFSYIAQGQRGRYPWLFEKNGGRKRKPQVNTPQKQKIKKEDDTDCTNTTSKSHESRTKTPTRPRSRERLNIDFIPGLDCIACTRNDSPLFALLLNTANTQRLFSGDRWCANCSEMVIDCPKFLAWKYSNLVHRPLVFIAAEHFAVKAQDAKVMHAPYYFTNKFDIAGKEILTNTTNTKNTTNTNASFRQFAPNDVRYQAPITNFPQYASSSANYPGREVCRQWFRYGNCRWEFEGKTCRYQHRLPEHGNSLWGTRWPDGTIGRSLHHTFYRPHYPYNLPTFYEKGDLADPTREGPIVWRGARHDTRHKMEITISNSQHKEQSQSRIKHESTTQYKGQERSRSRSHQKHEAIPKGESKNSNRSSHNSHTHKEPLNEHSKSRSKSRSSAHTTNKDSLKEHSKSRSRSRHKHKELSNEHSKSRSRGRFINKESLKEHSKSRSRSRHKHKEQSKSRSRRRTKNKEHSKSRSRSRRKRRERSKGRHPSTHRSHSREHSFAPQQVPLHGPYPGPGYYPYPPYPPHFFGQGMYTPFSPQQIVPPYFRAGTTSISQQQRQNHSPSIKNVEPKHP